MIWGDTLMPVEAGAVGFDPIVSVRNSDNGEEKQDSELSTGNRFRVLAGELGGGREEKQAAGVGDEGDSKQQAAADRTWRVGYRSTTCSANASCGGSASCASAACAC